MATHKDPAISVFTRSLGPPFILWVDAEGRTWKVVDEAFVPNEYPYLYYANTHEIERVKKVDGKTMYRLREVTVLTTPRGAIEPPIRSSMRTMARENHYAVIGIAAIVLIYLGTVALGWPQAGTAAVVHSHNAVQHATVPPPMWAASPFLLMLAAIAALPLIPSTRHWWESNLHRLLVAGVLGLTTLAYYALHHPHSVESHFLGHGQVERGEGFVSWALASVVLRNALLSEYVPFIVLLFSLYTVSGGIRISGNLPAHPSTNAFFIAIGGTLASFIGTTGAAMLLIGRYWRSTQSVGMSVIRWSSLSLWSATAAGVCFPLATRRSSWDIWKALISCGRFLSGNNGRS